MDEVEAVARAMWAVHEFPDSFDLLPKRSREFWFTDARAAIAALDACRQMKPDTSHLMWEQIGRKFGREAGLREAAAAANALGCLTTYQHGADIARAILALIDVGSPTPPTKD